MIAPPTILCGFPTLPRGTPTPRVEGLGSIQVCHGGEIPVTFLRWNLVDFEISDPEFAGLEGWILTVVVDLGGSQWQLSQSKGSFWTSCPDVPVGGLPAFEVLNQPHRPAWCRKSERFWPQVAGAPLPFMGQGFVAGYDTYLFGVLPGGPLAAHLVRRDEQDVEDHYDREEEDDGAAA